MLTYLTKQECKVIEEHLQRFNILSRIWFSTSNNAICRLKEMANFRRNAS